MCITHTPLLYSIREENPTAQFSTFVFLLTHEANPKKNKRAKLIHRTPETNTEYLSCYLKETR
jgi:hypothetical protein